MTLACVDEAGRLGVSDEGWRLSVRSSVRVRVCTLARSTSSYTLSPHLLGYP